MWMSITSRRFVLGFVRVIVSGTVGGAGGGVAWGDFARGVMVGGASGEGTPWGDTDVSGGFVSVSGVPLITPRVVGRFGGVNVVCLLDHLRVALTGDCIGGWLCMGKPTPGDCRLGVYPPLLHLLSRRLKSSPIEAYSLRSYLYSACARIGGATICRLCL